jgi:hypothetical protein
MKILFAFVSVLAMFYLAAQTNTVKDALNSLFFQSTNTEKQQTVQDPMFAQELVNKELLKELNVLVELSKQSAQNNDKLQARIDALEANVVSIEKEITNASASFSAQENDRLNGKPEGKVATMALVENVQSSALLTEQTMPIRALAASANKELDDRFNSELYSKRKETANTPRNILPAQQENEMLGATNTQSLATAEQQKRIQQQAILRSLSQKMELAALSSLSN